MMHIAFQLFLKLWKGFPIEIFCFSPNFRPLIDNKIPIAIKAWISHVEEKKHERVSIKLSIVITFHNTINSIFLDQHDQGAMSEVRSSW